MATSGTAVIGLVYASNLLAVRTPTIGLPGLRRIARATSSIGARCAGLAGWCSGFGRLRSARVQIPWRAGLLKLSGCAPWPESERVEQPAPLTCLDETKARAAAEVGAEPDISHLARELGGNSRYRPCLEETERILCSLPVKRLLKRGC